MEERLPKNVCCVGQMEHQQKIFVEEYVISFVQKTLKTEAAPQMIVFYGDGYEKDGCRYFFLNGAAAHAAFDERFGRMDEFYFQTVGKKYFSKWKGIGWYCSKGGGQWEDILEILQNICEQDFGNIKGYYIYFEKNPAMEDYMLHCEQKNDTDVRNEKQSKATDTEQPLRKLLAAVKKYTAQTERAKQENAVKTVKNVKDVKSSKARKHRRSASPIMAMQTLNMLSLCILIVCCIIAVTTLNQYDKMKRMEETVNYLEISMEEQKNLPDE